MILRTATIACIMFFFANAVYAEDKESPSIGALNSVTEGDIGDHLDYECHQLQNKLHCHFEQNIIMPTAGAKDTCAIIHHNFDEDYEPKADGLWVHESGPTGTCKAVDFTRFEKDISSTSGPTSWNYITQTTYTNINGSAFYGTALLSCKQIKESGAEKQRIYKPPVKPEKLGCLYITH